MAGGGCKIPDLVIEVRLLLGAILKKCYNICGTLLKRFGQTSKFNLFWLNFMHKLMWQTVALTVAFTAAAVHILGNIVMYVTASQNKLWTEIYPLMHPYAQWKTVSGFVIGLVEAFIAGYVVGAIFVWFFNMFVKEKQM